MSLATEDRNRRMLRVRGARDPVGNPIRLTQPAEGPIEIPSSEELRAQT